MKPITYSLLAAAFACGFASAQSTTATSPVVGYETLAMSPGFNFVGVRLHENPIAVGLLDSATTAPNTVTDNDINLGALITGGKTYILEIQNGSGIIQEITSAGAGTSIVTAANLTGLTYPCSYTLRPASTLNSVFGSSVATMKLDYGQGGYGGADQVWKWNGTGFTKYYFDQYAGPLQDQETWVNVDTSATVSGATVNLIYADSFIVSSAAGKDVTVSGDLKAGPTELNIVGGFNFAGSVGPVGMDLKTAFGDTAATVTASGVHIGQGGYGGADQIWLWNGTGFTKVYFDQYAGPLQDQELWVNVDTSATVPSTTALGAGFIISGAGAGNIHEGVPAYYTGL